MEKKVLLILVDGMRPDSLALCGNAYISELLGKSSYTLQAQTVMPSVTLPCHMSLFHSVVPERHGVLTNTYTPQVRPIDGLFEQVTRSYGKTAMFYDWEELRDVSRPGSLNYSYMAAGFVAKEHGSDRMHHSLQKMVKNICEYIPEESPDFCFFYIGLPDETGHKYGWMSQEYLDSVKEAWNGIETVMKILPEEYRVIITADHGGHDRAHGTEMKEDMTTPVICYGKEFGVGMDLGEVSIMDIAPTITSILDIVPGKDWEGRSLV